MNVPTNASTRRAGRPSEPVLSRELIIAEGMRLLSERGDAAVGMREIARELGVRPSALYNHVRNREDLISGIRDLICARMDVACFDELPWDEALEKWADSYVAAFAGHTLTIAYFAVAPIEHETGTSGMYERVVSGLLRAGWPEEQVLSIIVAFESFLLGSALDAGADPDMLDPGDSARDVSLTAAFRARKQALSAAGRTPAGEAYRIGRDLILAGLRAEYERRGLRPIATGK